MKDLPTTNCGKIPSKYIKEPFYNMGFKEGVIAERQRLQEEIKIVHRKYCCCKPFNPENWQRCQVCNLCDDLIDFLEEKINKIYSMMEKNDTK